MVRKACNLVIGSRAMKRTAQSAKSMKSRVLSMAEKIKSKAAARSKRSAAAAAKSARAGSSAHRRSTTGGSTVRNRNLTTTSGVSAQPTGRRKRKRALTPSRKCDISAAATRGKRIATTRANPKMQPAAKKPSQLAKNQNPTAKVKRTPPAAPKGAAAGRKVKPRDANARSQRTRAASCDVDRSRRPTRKSTKEGATDAGDKSRCSKLRPRKPATKVSRNRLQPAGGSGITKTPSGEVGHRATAKCGSSGSGRWPDGISVVGRNAAPKGRSTPAVDSTASRAISGVVLAAAFTIARCVPAAGDDDKRRNRRVASVGPANGSCASSFSRLDGTAELVTGAETMLVNAADSSTTKSSATIPNLATVAGVCTHPETILTAADGDKCVGGMGRCLDNKNVDVGEQPVSASPSILCSVDARAKPEIASTEGDMPAKLEIASTKGDVAVSSPRYNLALETCVEARSTGASHATEVPNGESSKFPLKSERYDYETWVGSGDVADLGIAESEISSGAHADKTRRQLKGGAGDWDDCAVTSFSPASLAKLDIPVAKDDIPVATDDIPVATDDIPIAEDYIPVATDYIPVVMDDIPVAKDDIPIAEDYIPVATDYIPVAMDDIPVAKDDIPVATDRGALLPVSPRAKSNVNSQVCIVPPKAKVNVGASRQPSALLPTRKTQASIDEQNRNAQLNARGRKLGIVWRKKLQDGVPLKDAVAADLSTVDQSSIDEKLSFVQAMCRGISFAFGKGPRIPVPPTKKNPEKSSVLPRSANSSAIGLSAKSSGDAYPLPKTSSEGIALKAIANAQSIQDEDMSHLKERKRRPRAAEQPWATRRRCNELARSSRDIPTPARSWAKMDEKRPQPHKLLTKDLRQQVLLRIWADMDLRIKQAESFPEGYRWYNDKKYRKWLKESKKERRKEENKAD